jgi:mono/diheme cytochrome c family protein
MRRSRFKYLILFCVLVIAGGGLYGWSALRRGFSAKAEPGAVETVIARRMRGFAIPRSARDARNPVPASPEVMARATAHFADHCAVCHGNDGRGKTLIGKGLYPKPTDMAQPATQTLTDGELYYTIENGIRFTGMPAFGEEGSGDGNTESWDLVHFIRHLPSITEEELAEMKKMNPRSPAELAREERMRKFLAGDDSSPADVGPEHHH